MNRRYALKYALRSLALPVVAGGTSAAFTSVVHAISAPDPKTQSAIFNMTIEEAKQSLVNERKVFTGLSGIVVGGTTAIVSSHIEDIRTDEMSSKDNSAPSISSQTPKIS